MRTLPRRAVLRLALTGGALLSVSGLGAVAASEDRVPDTAREFGKLKLDIDEWRSRLPEDRFRVLFEEATERPHSSPLDQEKRDGTYLCAACKLPLFDAAAKFDSGTGWPSFYQPLTPRVVGTKQDFKLIWPRTEYHCARCGGHQGHVFNDGPQPTGQRWCNNGLALVFVPRGTALPPLET